MKLIISEKDSTAKRISTILSGGKIKTDKINNVAVYTFKYDGADYKAIGLRGHIIKVDFPKEYSNWQKIEPTDLIDAPLVKVISQKMISGALKKVAVGAKEIVIATDFDREGELIGLEALEEAYKTSGEVPVRRARFSSLTQQEIAHSFSNLDKLYYDLAYAGEARQKIDLIWGATLTRFLSLASTRLGKSFLSVGRVQSPTLSLIVNKEKERQAFVPTKYWQIKAVFDTGENEKIEAGHKTDRFLSNEEATKAFDSMEKESKVLSLNATRKFLNPPAPFNTTAFFTAASTLGINPAAAMNIAEGLYMQGYISYPRVDNTVYPETMDHTALLETLREVPDFKPAVDQIMKQEKIVPTKGKKKATDHPPMHPTEAADKEKLTSREWRIYELVARRYLATLSEKAEQESLRVDIVSGSEVFIARGQRILTEGWLLSYPYSRKKDAELPKLSEGQNLILEDKTLEDKETQPPGRFGQGRLIEEMEKLGLGTKATRHSIIQNLYERGYVHGDPIEPTELGIAVSEALQQHAYLITTNEMTSELEKDMDSIAEGSTKQENVVDKSRLMLGNIMQQLKAKKEQVAEGIRAGIKLDQILGTCTNCGKSLRIMRAKKSKKRFVGCTGYPECTNSYPLPQFGSIVSTGETCGECNSPKIKVISKGSRPWILCINPQCPTKEKPAKTAEEQS